MVLQSDETNLDETPIHVDFLFSLIKSNWRAREASETPSIATYRKKCVYSTYVRTTMRMLTILREAEEWTSVHLREACLLFASAITKS